VSQLYMELQVILKIFSTEESTNTTHKFHTALFELKFKSSTNIEHDVVYIYINKPFNIYLVGNGYWHLT